MRPRNAAAIACGLVVGFPVALVFSLIFLGQATQQQLCGGAGASLSTAGEPPLVQYYIAAATRYGLGQNGYAYLAAINSVETAFGTNLSTSTAGAVGWMQFEPGTWATYGVSITNPGSPPDYNDPQDAIYGAANLLHASGAPADWYAAIFAYNHAAWYVAEVEGLAARYSGQNGLANLQADIATAWGGHQPTELPTPTFVSDSTSGGGGGGGCCPSTAAATIIAATASSFLQGLTAPQQAGFAVVSSTGQVLAQDNATLRVSGASITKAMLLVAYLEQLGNTPVPVSAQAELAPMIEISSNGAGTWAYSQVGAAGVQRVAHQAGMTGFRLDTSDPNYVLDQSTVTALDFARFFAQIDQLIPASNRAYALGLLSHISQPDQWGILAAGVAGVTASKAGWKPEASGWVVNQAAQIETGGQTVGLAVMTQGDASQAAGEEVLQTVATDLLATAASSSPAAAATSQCGPLNVDVVPVPGPVAVIMPSGLARPPAQAPQAVQAMIAAGDKIVHFDYQWGGGHANLSLSDSLTNPQPQGGPLPGTSGTPGYDCSGSTGYVLYNGGFSSYFGGPSGAIPASGNFTFGQPGYGRWVTWFYSGGHIFIEIAGILLDTNHDPGQFAPTTPPLGPRWAPLSHLAWEGPNSYAKGHPVGL